MVNMVSTGLIPNGKAIFITRGNDTINNFSFSGAQVNDSNGAGIRYEGGNLILNNDYFHNNQEGLLAASNPSGSITINNSEFANNGAGDGFSHNLYVNEIGTLTGNHIFGLSAGQIASGPSTQSGNDFLATEPAVDTSSPWGSLPTSGVIS